MADIKDQMWLKSLCRSYTEANVRTLAGWANGKDVDDDLKMRAIGMLMDRGWGKPQQDQNHEVKGEIRIVLRKMLEDEDLEE
jgi:hypothetical protein